MAVSKLSPVSQMASSSFSSLSSSSLKLLKDCGSYILLYGIYSHQYFRMNPPEMNTSQLLLVSTLGLGVNLFGMFAMGGHHHHVSQSSAQNLHFAELTAAGRTFAFAWALTWSFPYISTPASRTYQPQPQSSRAFAQQRANSCINVSRA